MRTQEAQFSLAGVGIREAISADRSRRRIAKVTQVRSRGTGGVIGRLTMPMQTTIRNPVSPDQLTLLQQVFDETCAQHQIDKASADGEALAIILVHTLQKGLGDREKLEALAQILAENR
jgi:hypothetical protein